MSIMGAGVMICLVISNFLGSWFPYEINLELFDTITKPVEAHIYGFHYFLFHGSTNDAFYCAVVSSEWGWWLWMINVNETCAVRDSFTGIHVEAVNLCFC